jgi:hypothetical protein
MNDFGLANIGAGIGAGLIATIVLSVIMLMKEARGVMPELNPIAMITRMTGTQTQAAGWIGHFLIGAILWGVLFAWLDPSLPGSQWFQGVLFATGVWIIMMVAVMPMAGAGLFGLKLSIMTPVATLVLHWVYGAVLGGIYGAWV